MGRCRRILTELVVLLSCLIVSPMVYAGTQLLNVATSQELQDALDLAEISTVNTRIVLAPGNYLVAQNGGNPFTYTAQNNKSLTLEGSGAGLTILDAQDSEVILELTDLISNPPNQLQVLGITFQNGGLGSAVSLETSDANIRVENCEFLNNLSPMLDGAGVNFLTVTGDVTLTNSFFSGNDSGGLGGGAKIFNEDGVVVVTNNIFFLNQADEGGGIHVSILGASVDFTNNTLTENAATGGNGGGFLMELDQNTAVINIFNNVIFNNTASGIGNDIFLDNTMGPNSDLQLFNNAFGEFCQNLFGPPMDCDLTFSIDQSAGGNIQQNPLLADPGSGDFTLLSNSPAIDKGVVPAPSMPATDFAGNPRPFGPLPDMGALEAVPIFAIDPTSINFGTTSPLVDPDVQTITLFNNGNYPLQVTNFSRQGDINFSLDVDGGANPCGTITPSIAPGTSCTMEIIFVTNEDGTFNAEFSFTSNDPKNPTIVVTATGSRGNGGGCSFGAEGMPQGVAILLWGILLFVVWRILRVNRKALNIHLH